MPLTRCAVRFRGTFGSTENRCGVQMRASNRAVNIFSQKTRFNSGTNFPVFIAARGTALDKDARCCRMFHFPEFGRLPRNAGSHGQCGPYSLEIASETAFLIATSHTCSGVSMAEATWAFQRYRASAPRSFGSTEVACSNVLRRCPDNVFFMANSSLVTGAMACGIDD